MENGGEKALNFKYNVFATVKLMFLMTIFVEFSILKMLISPNGIQEYMCAIHSMKIYIEHILVSLAFLVGGALILLRKL